MTTEEFLDGLYAIFDCRFPHEQLLEAFNGIIVEDNAAIIPFVEEIKKKYHIAVLSNTCECHWKKSRGHLFDPPECSLPRHFYIIRKRRDETRQENL